MGTGWNRHEYSTYYHDYLEDPSARFDKFLEGLEVVRAPFETDGLVTCEGRHYHLQGASFYPKPVQKPGPPIWLGGASAPCARWPGEATAVKAGRSVTMPKNCSTFKIETAIKCGQSPFFVLQF